MLLYRLCLQIVVHAVAYHSRSFHWVALLRGQIRKVTRSGVVESVCSVRGVSLVVHHVLSISNSPVQYGKVVLLPELELDDTTCSVMCDATFFTRLVMAAIVGSEVPKIWSNLLLL